MKTFLTLILTIQLAIFGHQGEKFIHAAPAAVESIFENEIPSGKDEDVKRFRDTYADRVKSYMNASVNPCDDFYEYACGNFPNVIEEIEVTRKRGGLIDLFFVLVDLVDKTLQKTRHADEEYYEELQRAKQFTDVCVSAKLWPMEPVAEYLDVLKVIGGFPAVDPSWNASAFDWFNMTAHLSRYGIEGLVKENIYLKHPFPPYFELPKLGFGFNAHLENIATENSPGYIHSESVMRKLLKIYGVTGSKADKVIDDVIEFWKDVLTVEIFIHRRGGCALAPLIDDSLRDDFPKWQSFFPIAWETSDFEITEASECPCPPFYDLLDKIATKKPEAVANYLSLKFLYAMDLELKSTKFQRRNCVIRVKNGMSVLLSHFYLKEYYNHENEEEIFGIISDLKDSLKDIVETADWLDEPTRAEALLKIKTLHSRVGLIRDPISDTMIKEMKRLNFTDNFALNNLQLAKFEVDMHHYNYLHPEIPVNTAPLDVLDAVQVNSFYYVLDNSINIMAGVLHPPVYHPLLPKSVKYGSLGYILGHELTHGFDKMGANFDSNMTQRYWWSEKSGQTFNERSNCFAQHYSGYEIPGMSLRINGTFSQDENLADSGGLREALAAYRKALKNALKNKDEDFAKNESLPGLDLNPEQMFFLSFAQLYCAKYNPKDFWTELSEDHPMDKYRVMGTLQNFEEFPLVFNCSLGTPMNPNEKCRLW